jgi:cytochrome c556
MKYFFFACLFAFTACTSAPQSDQVSKGLTANMKAMGARFKKLNEQVAKPELNAESASLATELSTLAANGKKFTPKSLSSMSEAEQKTAKADYDESLDQITQLSSKLATALRANDNAKAKEILKEITDTRKYGHDTYKK